ncbi:uncharacterized protein [Clytia hemisphaerica]|uniref:uncharacterized protein n=1 Tax=Clytia hemisphaerica TaxID=252671 RepID=UPI0034D54DB7|eukprot:TCONS_00048374-protein
MLFVIFATCCLATTNAKSLVPSSNVWPSLEQQPGIGYRYGSVQPLWMTHVGLTKVRGNGAAKSKDIPTVYWRVGDDSTKPNNLFFKDSIPPFFHFLQKTKSAMDERDERRIPLYIDDESDFGNNQESDNIGESVSVNTNQERRSGQHENQQKVDILRKIIEERESRVAGVNMDEADKRAIRTYTYSSHRLRQLLRNYLKSLSKLNKNKNEPRQAPADNNGVAEQDGIWGR